MKSKDITISKNSNSLKKPLIFLIVTLFLGAGLLIASRLSADFSEWYSINIYRFFVNILARLTGIFPFSLAETSIILTPFVIFTCIIALIVSLKRNKGRRKLILLKSLIYTLCAASSLFLIFMLNCGINYNRYTFFEAGDFSEREYTKEELRFVYYKLAEEFNEVLPLIHTDENGAFELTCDLRTAAPKALRNVAKTYPLLDTYYPSPKPVFNSEMMSRGLILGIYWPFTIEANYNVHAPDGEQPFAACHELAHLNGFMREEEASFIAFMACRNSNEPDMIFSAYSDVLGRILQNLDWEDWLNAPSEALEELALQDEYWYDYRFKKVTKIDAQTGEAVEAIIQSPIAETSSNINDGYLKAQGVEDGEKSYGRLLNLIIETYLAEA